MLVKTVKVSAKGQITLPAEAMRALKARKGTEFILVQEGERIILVKAADVGRKVADDTAGFSALGASSFAKVWDNEEDEVWNGFRG